MAWRKWMVRGIVWGIVGACAAGGLAYQRWTNPTAVREQVIAEIARAFPGARVSIDSARLRILGGIQVYGLRLTRVDDPDKPEFLHVPSAIFYHDKEKILEGEMRLRKIELIRPRVRIRREPNGTWNLDGLVKKPDSTAQALLPAIVIHQGTLIVEDHSDVTKATTLEINDVGVTIINDPLPRVNVRGAANSTWLGKVSFAGTVDRQSGELHMSFRAPEIRLTQTLLSRLPIQCPADFHVGLQASANARLEGKVSYHPAQPQPLYYDIHCAITNGTLQHPRIPLTWTDVECQLHCNNGTLRIEKLKARSGATEVTAHGIAQLPCVDQEFEVHADLRHVILGDELARRLPDKIQEMHRLFQPSGPTSIHIACARHDGDWAALASGDPSMVTMRPEEISVLFKGFPYPLSRVKGDIDLNLLDDQVKFSLDGYAGDRPILLGGYWNGEGKDADVKIDIVTKGDGVIINNTLIKALPRNLQSFAASFNAIGRVKLNAHISQRPGKGFRNEFHLHFHDGAIRWNEFPYPVENVSGFLDIYPEHWEFHDFKGTHKGGHVLLNGKSIPHTDHDDEGFGVSMEITGRNIRLDSELKNALRPMKDLHKAWETFQPTGQLSFTASVQRPSADLDKLEVDVDARGATVKPSFFPYRVQDISGRFKFKKMRLEIAKLRARHEDALIALDHGAVDLNPRGGYFAKFDDVQMQGLRFDNEFVEALPGKLQVAAKMLKLDDPLKVKTQVMVYQAPEQGRPPDVYWDGELWMYGAKLNAGVEFSNVTGWIGCRGRYDGRQVVGVEGNILLEQATVLKQPIKKSHAKFEIRKETPDVLLIGLRTPVFSGDVTGQVVVFLNSAMRYEMNLTASQINLAEFGRHNLGPKSQISGTGGARLYLTGLGAGISTLDGNGSINIPRAHLYNLPFLFDLLKFLGLHWPDRTAFEEFHADFNIQGGKVHVNKLDMIGSAISLAGKGDIYLDSKKVELDVYPMWGRVDQLLPPVVRPFPTTISKNLLSVEVRGKLTTEPKDLKYRLKPMPIFLDPILSLRDRMVGPSGGNDAPGRER